MFEVRFSNKCSGFCFNVGVFIFYSVWFGSLTSIDKYFSRFNFTAHYLYVSTCKSFKMIEIILRVINIFVQYFWNVEFEFAAIDEDCSLNDLYQIAHYEIERKINEIELLSKFRDKNGDIKRAKQQFDIEEAIRTQGTNYYAQSPSCSTLYKKEFSMQYQESNSRLEGNEYKLFNGTIENQFNISVKRTTNADRCRKEFNTELNYLKK